MTNNIQMALRKCVKHFTLVCALMGIASVAAAHGRWILPDRTILSGDKQVVSIDLSISNGIFHPDVPMGGVSLINTSTAKQPVEVNYATANSMGDLRVLKPDGTQSEALPLVNVGRKSVSAYELIDNGTYRLRMLQSPLLLTYFKDGEGKTARLFGGYEQVKKRLPENASDISTLKLYHYLESFLTLNDVSDKALLPTGTGLEVSFSEHPNALFVNESATLSFLLHGKPVGEGVSVRLTSGGTRFRNHRESIELLTDKHGQVSVVWNSPGMLLIEAEYDRAVEAKGYETEGHHLFVTLEINPE